MKRLTDNRLCKAIETDTYIEVEDLKEARKQPSVQDLYVELNKYEKIMKKYNIEDLEGLDRLLGMATTYEELSKQVGCSLDEAIDLLLKAFSKTDDYRCLTCINSMRGALYGCDGSCQHKDSYTKKEIINLIKKREDKSE